MIDTVQEKVQKLFAEESRLISREKVVFRARDVAYFYIDEGAVKARLADGTVHALDEDLSALERRFRGLFIRTYRYHLVNVKKIVGASRRYPTSKELEEQMDLFDEDLKQAVELTKEREEEECELHLEGCADTVPVTSTYSEVIQDLLGISTFRHLVPEHPEDRRLRELELTDFGWRDLARLDPEDLPAVEAFKERWDIKRLDQETMIKYFRQVGAAEIDKRRVIKNIIWQLYRWIKKGIEPLSDGNIRSLWYRIKAVLAYHSDILEPGDVDSFYDVLIQMIEGEQLFRYKDFGFMDVNEPYRGIGATRPEIILSSEKVGHYPFIRKLAEDTGVSFICLKGEPAHISLEYFSDDLWETVGKTEKKVLSIADIDPAGYSIESNLVEGLERHGHRFEKVVSLVDMSIFETEDIGYARYPVVQYEERSGGHLAPIPPATMSQVTKARDWFENVLQDERLFTSKMVAGRKICTIWGIESDAAERAVIRERFLQELG